MPIESRKSCGGLDVLNNVNSGVEFCVNFGSQMVVTVGCELRVHRFTVLKLHDVWYEKPLDIRYRMCYTDIKIIRYRM